MKNIKNGFTICHPKHLFRHPELDGGAARTSGSRCLLNKERFRIKYGMTAFNNNTAFTLIELLVVVLIIGILAAVAVPQYQKAVDKSRIATLLPNLKTMYQGGYEYYLANGKWQTDFFCDYSATITNPSGMKLKGLPFSSPECHTGYVGKVDFVAIYFFTDLATGFLGIGIVKPANASQPEFICSVRGDTTWCKKMGFTKIATGYVYSDFTSAPLGTVYVKE